MKETETFCKVCKGTGNCHKGYLETEKGMTKCPFREWVTMETMESIEDKEELIPDVYKQTIVTLKDIEDKLVGQRMETKDKWIGNMGYLMNCVRDNVKPNKSLMFNIPPSIDINDIELVYNLMAQAMSTGKTVTPYYDSYEFDLFSKHYQYQSTPNKRFPITYDDYVSRDLCFIKYKAGVIMDRDIQMVNSLIDQRARKGLPTIVITPYNIKYLKDAEPIIESFVTVDEQNRYDKMLYLHLDIVGKEKE